MSTIKRLTDGLSDVVCELVQVAADLEFENRQLIAEKAELERENEQLRAELLEMQGRSCA